jgi:Zn-dependent peptidase ImmA (M78 family)
MKAQDLAQNLIEKFGTNDVFEIALKAGAKIVYEDWYPTTIGEFDKNTKTICVNRRVLSESKNADDLEKVIIAHELGHFFVDEFKIETQNEESFAREFAKELTKNKSE